MKQVLFLTIITITMFIKTSCTETHFIDASSEKSVLISPIDTTTQVKEEAIVEIKDSITAIRKCIYLTIDDGPLNGGKYIDSVVSMKKVKTNLFVVGSAINGSNKFRKYYEMFQANSHIEIYNHSYSHANNRYTEFYKNPISVLDDFEKNRSEFNILYKIARLPGRNLWQVGELKKNFKQTGATSAELLAENGYKIYGWDIEWEYNPKDYSPKQNINELIAQIDSAYNSNKTFTPQHVVLLMHDQMFRQVSEQNDLEELINKLKESDYTFEYLSSYPEGKSL